MEESWSYADAMKKSMTDTLAAALQAAWPDGGQLSVTRYAHYSCLNRFSDVVTAFCISSLSRRVPPARATSRVWHLAAGYGALCQSIVLARTGQRKRFLCF